MSISILILTLDEGTNIEDCLRSVAWATDIVVLDSMSSDETPAIAERNGARIFYRAFDTYAQQRNFGLREIEFEGDWILMLDADERVPGDLKAEMEVATENAPPDVSMFTMRRRDYLWGTWIKRSGGYPTWFGRLSRKNQSWVERSVNEVYVSSGRSMQLSHHLDHYPFNKGIAAWIAKHNLYSSMEADILASSGARSVHLLSLVSRSPSMRRQAWKALLYRLPVRPVIVFIGLYFLRGGIVEGRAGLTFCLLRSWYEFMINCKVVEIVRGQVSRQGSTPTS